ncbi:MAG: FtsX-like permease family protein [Patescibacteria group bacterium]
MFYLRYLWAELTRRWGKTLTVSLGLAMASAIIITILSLSQSLSAEQDKVLNPLQNVGTDIMVTRTVNQDNIESLDETTRADMMKENQISTDLSKLGNPGDQFTSDSFLPGTLLTYDAAEITKLDSSLVANAAAGLILNVTHQEGKIPQVTAEITTGGEQFEVNQEIAEMTDAERAAVDAARTKAENELKAKGIDPRSEEGRQYVREAERNAMPERFRSMTFRFTAPTRTYKQDIGAISTDITTTNFTVAGVDTTKTDIGLILPDQITSGSYFNGENQVVVNQSYADKNSIKLGDKITLAKQELTVVGLVTPKLYTNTADLYLSLADLQKLAGRESRINVMLVKAANAKDVAQTSEKLSSAFTGATVTDSSDTAREVTGSLVSAANLTNKFIGVTTIIVVIASFIIVSLLTVFSVNKRVREIGTLKAIGWKNSLIVRQIIGENIVIGVIGAALGLGLALGAIVLLNHFNISLTATIGQTSDIGGPGGFGFVRRFMGTEENAGVTTSVPLKIALDYSILLLGTLVALVGAIVAGSLAALKSSKMKPQEALRHLE